MTATAQFTAFTPFDTARPQPTEAERDEAERIIAEHGSCSDPVKRAERVQSMARILVQRRLETDWRTTIAIRVIQALAVALADPDQSQQEMEQSRCAA